MLENIFTNVFGRPKSKNPTRSSQNDPAGLPTSSTSGAPMTGPFSNSAPQMPQPSHLPYPAAPYQGGGPAPTPNAYTYPSLPFSQPPPLPPSYSSGMHPGASSASHGYGTLVTSQASPLDSVPFEPRLMINNSTNLVELFKEIKKETDRVDRADAYLRSSQSDYDFKVEQNLISQ